jgi:hypothetical protein
LVLLLLSLRLLRLVSRTRSGKLWQAWRANDLIQAQQEFSKAGRDTCKGFAAGFVFLTSGKLQFVERGLGEVTTS